MMECKKALTESQGEMELAIENLRKAGIAKAGKKAGRIAAEGAIIIKTNGKQAAMVEINCETDFVARDTNFTAFVNAVAETALQEKEQETHHGEGKKEASQRGRHHRYEHLVFHAFKL